MSHDDDIAFACVDCANALNAIYNLLTDSAVNHRFTLINAEVDLADLITRCSALHVKVQLRHAQLNGGLH